MVRVIWNAKGQEGASPWFEDDMRPYLITWCSIMANWRRALGYQHSECEFDVEEKENENEREIA